MSRHTAILILTAGLGQLISITKHYAGREHFYRLSAISLRSGWEYDEDVIIERPRLHEIVYELFPCCKAHYDVESDLIEQSYLDRLTNERKLRIAKQKANRRSLLQDSLSAGDENI